MTEKEYLKMIAELVSISSEAIGFLTGVAINDNGYQVQLAAKELVDNLKIRMSFLLDDLNEKPNK